MNQRESTACCPKLASTSEWLALVLAAVALLGSLDFSIRHGLQACPLCIYERTFLMAVVGILGLCNLVPKLREPGIGTRLALPLALAGLGVVAFHVRLELVEKMICPYGYFKLGTAPAQSLTAYVLICGLLTISLIGSAGARWLVPGVILGGVFAYASIASAPAPTVKAEPAVKLRQRQESGALLGCTPVSEDTGPARPPMRSPTR